MKVAVIGPTYPIRGGISHYTTLMVRELRKRHRVLLVSYRKQYPRLLFPGRTQVDCSCERIETESEPLLSFVNPFSLRRAADRVAGFSPDVTVMMWVNPVLALHFRYLAGRLRKSCPSAPLVFLCHNVLQHERRVGDRALSKAAFRNADSFIVHGERQREELEGLAPGVPVYVTPLPTFDVFACSAPKREEARASLGIEEDARVLLFFGIIRRYKGLEYLLEAMPEINRLTGGVKLLVVGEFWEGRNECASRIERLGIADAVTLVDRYVPNEEVRIYFRAADLVVLPYVQASASAILQIAYGFGLPVVATLVGALSEVVEDGKTGYLVPPKDPEAIARAVHVFFSYADPAEFRRNIQEYRRRFTWEGLARTVEEAAGGGQGVTRPVF